MIKYLVTGGCGFIGSHVADQLVEKGYSVCILDDLSSGFKEQIPDEAELIVGSITDPAAVEHALRGVSGIFHLAAIPSVTQSIQEWHHTHTVNSGGTVLLFEQALNIPLVYASSSAVYGNCLHLPLKEESPLQPLSPYAADKLFCEFHAKIAWRLHCTPSIGFRLFNVFGPRQNPHSAYSGVISTFSHKIAQKEPITIYGDGKQTRDFIYVKEVASMMVQAMERDFTGASVYNLCSGSDISINELADLIGKIAHVKITKQYAPEREGEIVFSQGDPSKLFHEWDFKSKISLEKGLMELMQEMAGRAIVR